MEKKIYYIDDKVFEILPDKSRVETIINIDALENDITPNGLIIITAEQVEIAKKEILKPHSNYNSVYVDWLYEYQFISQDEYNQYLKLSNPPQIDKMIC